MRKWWEWFLAAKMDENEAGRGSWDERRENLRGRGFYQNGSEWRVANGKRRIANGEWFFWRLVHSPEVVVYEFKAG